MRGHLQQERGQLVGRLDLLIGWLLALGATAVYLLCLEPSTSFWDAGEFISVSALLQVGHPPGAPLYQLLAHVFTLFAGSNMLAVAPWCNALSALSAGLTVMFLYWTILLLFQPQPQRPLMARHRVAALVGSLCYLFCDTAWFSAVESEVYSLAMLIASAALWAMLHWYRCPDRRQAQRWLLLVALLMGMGYCVHQLALLTSPTLLLLFIFKAAEEKKAGRELPFKAYATRIVPMLLLFFALGLSPYLIIPIRAAAGTPINEGHPATVAEFKAYLGRDNYEKAPLYPRMWRHRPNDLKYGLTWSGGDTSFVGNMTYYGSYQLTYMYLRYLMWNFSGRYNDRQGYGSAQNGQFLTGLAPLDRLLVGTAERPPESLHTRGHNVYYMLPLLLGILGLVVMTDEKKAFWAVLTLFLMGGVVLSVYLNHPCYEPRERDYAYVLSFYAFCIFIGHGAGWLVEKIALLLSKVRLRRPVGTAVGTVLVLAVPLLMACQNWDDHDRSGRYIAHDAGANILNSCDSNELGAVLFCYGDNDTFPLWYLQTVEQTRLDVRVENIGLMGWSNFAKLLSESREVGRPVYFTHYAFNRFRDLFPDQFQLEGNAYRLCNETCDSVAVEPCYRHVMEAMGWQPMEGVYIDETCCKFLEQYWSDVVLLAENLTAHDMGARADSVLSKTLGEIPLTALQSPELVYRIAQAFEGAGRVELSQQITTYLRKILEEQLRYFHTLPPDRQRGLVFTLAPREELAKKLSVVTTS